jgi:4-hydroxymandelate oxidase
MKCATCGAGPGDFRRHESTERRGPSIGYGKVGDPFTLEDARVLSRKKMKGICAAYPNCNGAGDNVCQKEAYGAPIGMGGVGLGYSFANNSKALKKIRVKTRLVGDHFEPDMSFDFFGMKLDFPIMGASTSGMAGYDESVSELEFCLDTIRGCLDAGSISWRGDTHFYSEDQHFALLAVEQSGGQAIPIFKPRAQDVLKRLIERAEKLGVKALGVDLDGCGSTNMSRGGQPVFRKSPKDLRELVNSTSLPFIFKGIMDPDDAEACADAGAKVVSVSNHGGRVMDTTPGVAEVLPAIVKRVGDRVMITADGGVRTGYDAFKMLALGADCVLIGRDVIRAALGGGRLGVGLQMARFKATLSRAMVMTGCQNLAAIDRGSIYE